MSAYAVRSFGSPPIHEWGVTGPAGDEHSPDWSREDAREVAKRYDAVHAAALSGAATCCWRPSRSQPEAEAGVWDTDCGEQHIFFVDGPTENKCRFCCYCGKPLEEKPA